MSIIQNVWTPFNIQQSSEHEAMDVWANVFLHWNDKIQSVTLKSLSHKYMNAAYYTSLT